MNAKQALLRTAAWNDSSRSPLSSRGATVRSVPSSKRKAAMSMALPTACSDRREVLAPPTTGRQK